MTDKPITYDDLVRVGRKSDRLARRLPDDRQAANDQLSADLRSLGLLPDDVRRFAIDFGRDVCELHPPELVDGPKAHASTFLVGLKAGLMLAREREEGRK